MEVFFILSFFVLTVNSVAIQGPKYTRYDPCSQGVVYLEKIPDTLSWRGVINFQLYPNISDPEIEVDFAIPMMIYKASQNTTITTNNNFTHFVLKPRGMLPPQYHFFVSDKYDTRVRVPIVTKVKLNGKILCNDAVKSKETIQSLNLTQPDDPYHQHVCGRRALRNSELTSIKAEAKPGDWPWHVAVLIRDLNTDYAWYQCGGNIISRTAVLTAGHCVFLFGIRLTEEQIVVEAGVVNLMDPTEPGRQLLQAVDIIVHPSYNTAEATADMAIIRVNQFQYTAFVQPICVWGPTYDKASLVGKSAVVAGFGITEKHELSNTLRSTYTVVQNDSTCIGYAPRLYGPLLNEFTFCAGLNPQSGTSPLQGDSGGGLVVATVQPDDKISFFLRGLLSKCGVPEGKAQCSPNFYVVYVNVAPHYSWIYHNAGLTYVCQNTNY